MLFDPIRSNKFDVWLAGKKLTTAGAAVMMRGESMGTGYF